VQTIFQRRNQHDCLPLLLPASASTNEIQTGSVQETIIGYLAALLDEGNPRAFAAGLGDVARARGMSQIARDAGLSHESLYKALSGERNPELGTVMGVMQALGLKLVPAGLVQLQRKRPATRQTEASWPTPMQRWLLRHPLLLQVPEPLQRRVGAVIDQ
jgi:probable addiction module antidote protein